MKSEVISTNEMKCLFEPIGLFILLVYMFKRIVFAMCFKFKYLYSYIICLLIKIVC